MSETPQISSSRVSPNEFILEHLPSLINSSDPHDRLGASISATYLAQQGEMTRAKYNLAITASNLVSYTESANRYDEVRDESRLLRVGVKMAERLLPGALKHEHASALLSLAVYKVEEGYTRSIDEAKDDFQQAIDATSKWYRPAFKDRWLGGYYRGWLRKPDPTETELMGIEAARKLMKPINPINVIQHVVEGRTYKKKRQHKVKLDSDFEAFIAKKS